MNISKKRNYAQYLKWGLYIIFIAGIGISFVNEYIPLLPLRWIRLMYAMSIAGLVGIGTNTIAIMMLFHPAKKTIFLRQGILPANRVRIARSIAQAIKERIINEESITSFLFEEQRIERYIRKVFSIVKDFLRSSSTHKALQDIFRYLKKSTVREKWVNFLSNVLEREGKRVLSSNEVSFSRLFTKVRGFIQNKKQDELFYNTGNTLKWLIKELVKRNSEKIAEKINLLLERYAKSRAMGLGVLLRRVFIPKKSVQKWVSDFVENEEDMRLAGDFIEEMLFKLDIILSQTEAKKRFHGLYIEYRSRLLGYLQEYAIPEVIRFIEDFIDKLIEEDDFLKDYLLRIEHFLIKHLHTTITFLKKRITPFVIKDLLTRLKIGDNVSRLVYNNIMAQSSKDFEVFLNRIIKESLSWIEILGGLIGGIMGVALIYKIGFFFLPGIIGMFLLTEYLLTRWLINDR